ncbi:DUF349 domain-containing protein [Myroides odoratimimus]|uniref:DUF349 domain-containing protein n=1 Tax=Myroides odoratimimus TaxID=76832 RepID=UPI000914971C|nr:DUF349 domain-containing protein [Myroides odoratimimus]SHM24357.1 protein of unknown function [Myroides odoratimimus subsp. xuanwuensis]
MLEQKNDNLHELADGQKPESNSNAVVPTDKEKALDSITASNAEEGEDLASYEESNIPTVNYEKLDLEKLTKELHKLIKNYKVTAIKDHVEDIKKEFYTKYNDLVDEKKEAFFDENPDANESDFQYILPIKTDFDKYYDEYRVAKNAYFKQLQNNLNVNLEKRLSIIEKLKQLIENEHNGDALKQLGELREEWKTAGPIPKDKYNHVWNNYHFHVERFYDQLHLDRESRDLDFKYNLEQKQKLIARAEELLENDDIIKSFRELQTLHRIWKEEIGPVDREIREQIWDQFSEITKQLHDKREILFEQLRSVERENLALKVAIISEIDILSKQKITNHNQWQKEIAKVEELRQRFFSIGKVPLDNNEQVWDLFKLATRNFNSNKNAYYKELKKEQQDNYAKKLALIKRAQELKDSEDFAKVTPIMKKIQDDWKLIGHVPRKYSDQLWADFKEACNSYFDRYHAIKNKESAVELDAYNRKKEYLDLLRGFQLSGDHKTDLGEIKNHINNWKSIGAVPANKRFIEGKFNKILDVLFDKLSLSKRETEAVKFNNRLESILETNDKRKLQNEALFIQRKIEEINSSIIQLENNLAYIHNATDDNPFVKEVKKSIEKQRDDLKIWEDKLTQIRNI